MFIKLELNHRRCFKHYGMFLARDIWSPLSDQSLNNIGYKVYFDLESWQSRGYRVYNIPKYTVHNIALGGVNIIVLILLFI